MPREFGLAWAIGYYLIIGVIVAGVNLFWEMVLGPSSLYERFFPTAEPGSPIVDFLLTPLMLFVGLWVMTGIVHLFLLMLRAGKNEFGTTARVFCYSIGPTVFDIVPFIGPPVGAIWSLVITIIGLREAHETTTGRAVAAILLPLFLLLILFALLFLAGLAIGVSTVT